MFCRFVKNGRSTYFYNADSGIFIDSKSHFYTALQASFFSYPRIALVGVDTPSNHTKQVLFLCLYDDRLLSLFDFV